MHGPGSRNRLCRMVRESFAKGAALLPSDSVHVARSPPQIDVAVPFSGSNLRRDTKTPPPQAGVYVPRRLAARPTRGDTTPDARLIRSRQPADLGGRVAAAVTSAAPGGTAPSRRPVSGCPRPSRSIGTRGASQLRVTAYSRIVTPVRGKRDTPSILASIRLARTIRGSPGMRDRPFQLGQGARRNSTNRPGRVLPSGCFGSG